MRINNIKICEVVSVDDEYDGERIKVRVYPDDNSRKDSELPWAYPLLPMHLHVKPKVGEAVDVIFGNSNEADSVRRYIGPIVSQPQDLGYSDFGMDSTSTKSYGNKPPKKAVSSRPETRKLMAGNDDVAIYGRKNSDIILSENDLNIRCGVRKETADSKDLIFNRLDPSYIKLRYEDSENGNSSKYKSTATVVSDKITLVSNNSPMLDTEVHNVDNLISEEDMAKLVESAQRLPYGDKLLDFIKVFINAFKTHTHRFVGAGSYPVESDSMKALSEYNDEKLNSMFSDDIRII